MIKRIILLSFIFLLSDIRCYAEFNISAKAYVVIEQSTNTVIYSKNPDLKLKPASTTKILTGICALENGNLNDKVVISDNAAYEEGSSLYLEPGDSVSLENLIYGLMLNSGNDAAVAISEYISKSEEEFSKLMNKKAKEIGAKNSNFENPHGLDSDNHYTTAYDLALITSYALNSDKFSKIVSTKSKVIKEDGGFIRYLSNHNKMLRTYEGCIGVKTGFTKKSGRTLVTAAKKDGVKLIAVTLNAPDDWNDHKKLLDEGFKAVSKKNILNKKEKISMVEVKNGEKNFVPVRCKDEFDGVYLKNKQIQYDVVYKYQSLTAPVKEGQVAGKAFVYKDGKKIFETEILTTEKTEKNKGSTFYECVKKVFKLW